MNKEEFLTRLSREISIGRIRTVIRPYLESAVS